MVRLTGAVDLHTADRFRGALNQLLDEQPELLVVDLDGLEFLSSAGLSVLVATHNRGAMAVVAGRPIVLRPLQLTGLTEVLNVHPSLDAACAPSTVDG